MSGAALVHGAAVEKGLCNRPKTCGNRRFSRGENAGIRSYNVRMATPKTFKYLWFVVLIQIALVAALVYVLVPKLSVGLIQVAVDQNPQFTAYEIATQIGRLDAVSLALAFLGIGVGFFAIFSFFAIREDAEDRAQRVAEALVDHRLSNIEAKMYDQISIRINAALERRLSVSMDAVDLADREKERRNHES